jgi:hypothetical protein
MKMYGESMDEKIERLERIIYKESSANYSEFHEALIETNRIGGGGSTKGALFAMEVAEDLKKGKIG